MNKFLLYITAAADKIYTARNVPAQKKNNTRRAAYEVIGVAIQRKPQTVIIIVSANGARWALPKPAGRSVAAPSV